MKKFILVKSMLLILVSSVLLSCNQGNEGVDEYSSFGTIISSTTTEMTLKVDDGTIVNLISTTGGLSSEYVTKRAIAYFTLIGGEEQLNTKEINGELYSLNIFTTQPPKYVEGRTDEELDTEFGSKKIRVDAVSVGDGYLDITCTFGYTDPDAKRSYELIIDESKSTSTDVYAKLYYKADDAKDNDYDFASKVKTIVCFNLSRTAYAPSDGVSYHIEYIDSEYGDEIKTYTAKSDNSHL